MQPVSRAISARNAGFALPLSLGILIIVMLISLWANKGVLNDLWATIVQKRSTTQFYAAEAGARWVLVNFLYTGMSDALTSDDPVEDIEVTIPTSEGNVPVEVTVRFLNITRDCDFKAVCCRRFEIKSKVQDSDIQVRFLALKAIPNPEQDEQAKKVCVM